MTTKELIQQYVTAHSDNRWMDASELETLLTEFAEKLKEPVSEDVDEAAKRYAKEEYSRKSPASPPDRCRGCYAPIMYAFEAGAQWDREQMMKDAVEAVVSQVPCANEIIFRNPASVSYWYLPSEMNRLGINKGDKVKVIIVKE